MKKIILISTFGLISIFGLIFISLNKVVADDIYEDIVETALKNINYLIEVKLGGVDDEDLMNEIAIKNRKSNFVPILLKKGFVIKNDEFKEYELIKNRDNYYHSFILVKDTICCRVTLKFENSKMVYRYYISEELWTFKSIR